MIMMMTDDFMDPGPSRPDPCACAFGERTLGNGEQVRGHMPFEVITKYHN
jgi:hypothetical protein